MTLEAFLKTNLVIVMPVYISVIISGTHVHMGKVRQYTVLFVSQHTKVVWQNAVVIYTSRSRLTSDLFAQVTFLSVFVFVFFIYVQPCGNG